MKEQKFYIPAIVLGAVGILLQFFMLGAEAVIAGGIGLGMSVAKRRTHRTRLSLVLSVIAVIGGLGWLIWYIHLGTHGMGGTSYWLFRLIFGDPVS